MEELKKITQEELNEVIRLHELWLKTDHNEGECADLSCCDLSYVKLRNVNLSNANLSYADLFYTNLFYTNLCNVNLHHANLSHANLSHANLSNANLSQANLSYTNLSYAYLRNVDLSYANLSYANLSYADLCSTHLHNICLYNTDLQNSIINYNDSKLIIDNIFQVSNIGSRNDITNFYILEDGGIFVTCGCFKGMIDEFESQVKEVHQGNKFEIQYLCAIELAKSKLES